MHSLLAHVVHSCCHSGGEAGKDNDSDSDHDDPDKKKLESQPAGEISGLSHHSFCLERRNFSWQVLLSVKSPTFTGLM